MIQSLTTNRNSLPTEGKNKKKSFMFRSWRTYLLILVFIVVIYILILKSIIPIPAMCGPKPLNFFSDVDLQPPPCNIITTKQFWNRVFEDKTEYKFRWVIWE